MRVPIPEFWYRRAASWPPPFMLARRTRLDGLKIEHTSKRTSAAFGFARWEFALLGELQSNLSVASYTCPLISWIWHYLLIFPLFPHFFPHNGSDDAVSLLSHHQAPTVRKFGNREYLLAVMAQ